jgi:insertion element IS1 protein InsB
MECKYCSKHCVKAGLQHSGVQKFYCSACSKYQQAVYKSEAYHPQTNSRIVNLLKEGIGLRSMARVLRISLKTIIHRIRQIAATIRKPFQNLTNRIYEIDEMWTYVGRKTNEVWILYILDRKTRMVVDFRVGSRSKKNIRPLTDQLLNAEPKAICTDGLTIYKTLIPRNIHRVSAMSTRHIERHNLNLRMHLKRVSRKTICFSKSVEMLQACLRIYFWRSSRYYSHALL